MVLRTKVVIATFVSAELADWRAGCLRPCVAGNCAQSGAAMRVLWPGATAQVWQIGVLECFAWSLVEFAPVVTESTYESGCCDSTALYSEQNSLDAY